MTRWTAGVALASALFVRPAAAQPSSATSATAETLFREGKALTSAAEKLSKDGKSEASAQRFDEAIEKFRASQELEPSVGVLLSLGDAYRARGKVTSAWGSYVAARDLARTKNDARVADAEQRANEVSPRLPRMTVKLSAPAPEVKVTDNGQALPLASIGVALPVDPGPHELVVTAKGKRPYRVTEEIAERQAREVVIPALEVDPASLPPAPAAPAPVSHTQRDIGTGLAIGGGVVTVAGLVVGALAISKWGKVTDRCPGGSCRTNADRDAVSGERDTAQAFATISTVSVIVGIVAAGTGFALRITAPAKTGQVDGLGFTFQ